MQLEDWGLDAPLTPEDIAEMDRGMKVIALRKEIAKAAFTYRAMWKLADDALTQGGDPQTADRLLGEENAAREHLFALLRQFEEVGGTREG